MPYSYKKKKALSLDIGSHTEGQGEGVSPPPPSPASALEAPPMKKMATQDKPIENKETENEPPLWVFQLNPFLHVNIQKWQGEWRVDLRRQELKDGRLVPTKKGISLTIDKAGDDG